MSDSDTEATAAVAVDVARGAQSGDQTAPSPKESKGKAAANKNIVGRLNNLVTIDIQTITRGRDWLFPGKAHSLPQRLRTLH